VCGRGPGDFEPCHRIAIFTQPAPRLYEQPLQGVNTSSTQATQGSEVTNSIEGEALHSFLCLLSRSSASLLFSSSASFCQG
jgi:hypothetical protein